MKYTDGPWHVVDPGHPQGRPAIVIGRHLRILVDHAEDFGDPLPDARLIAVTPDLYNVLKDVVRYYREAADRQHQAGSLVLQMAEELIAEVEKER